MKNILILVFFVLSQPIFAQQILILPVSGARTWCPGEDQDFEVSTPGSQQTNCKYKWTITNGTIKAGSTQRKVKVAWNDVASIGTLQVTLSDCTDVDNETATESYVIKSLKGVNPANLRMLGGPISVCNMSAQIDLKVDRIYVPNTGVGSTVPSEEVDGYEWSLSRPAEWNIIGSSEMRVLTPKTACAGGTVKVRGYMSCTSGKKYSEWSQELVLRTDPTFRVTQPNGSNMYTHECGVDNTVTFSVNPISCASGYTWVFPSGWKTSSGASSEVITVDPNVTLVSPPAGTPKSAIEGNIRATANLGSCQMEAASATIKYSDVPLQTPSFSLFNSVLCSGSSSAANVQSIDGAISYTWYSVPTNEGFYSGNVKINNLETSSTNPVITTTTSTTLTAPMVSGNERFGANLYVRANRVAGCAPSNWNMKEIWVGPFAQVHLYTLYVQGYRGVNPVTLSAAGVYNFQIDPVGGATAYSWILPSGFSFYDGFSTTGYLARIRTVFAGGIYTLKVYPQGPCGTSGTGYQSLTINIPGGTLVPSCPTPPCSIGPAPASIYPNPADEMIYISLTDTDELTGMPAKVELLNTQLQPVKLIETIFSTIAIETDILPAGLYYARITRGSSIVVVKIQVHH